MSTKPSKEILDFMAAHKISSNEIWQVHGNSRVIKHKALERVAAEKGVVWDRPALIETNSKDGIVAICVFGKIGDRAEWSIGEASPKNCKNSYYYAMAEKRAKDRVILKLLTSHGLLYSEAEADEFEETKRLNPHVTRPADIVPGVEYDQHGEIIDNIPTPDEASIKKLRVVDQRPIFEALQKEIHATGSVPELAKWAADNKNRLGSLKPDWQDFLRGVYAEHLTELRRQARGDDMRLTA